MLTVLVDIYQQFDAVEFQRVDFDRAIERRQRTDMDTQCTGTAVVVDRRD